VLRASWTSSERIAEARQPADSGNQPNAHAAASSPASSAITWLFADEPWLRSVASQFWWCHSCSWKSGLSSNNAVTPSQPSSRRRTQTHDSSRMPSSMPLTQCGPRSGGFSAHHERRCAATRAA
jgi:hypothetical protein